MLIPEGRSGRADVVAHTRPVLSGIPHPPHPHRPVKGASTSSLVLLARQVAHWIYLSELTLMIPSCPGIRTAAWISSALASILLISSGKRTKTCHYRATFHPNVVPFQTTGLCVWRARGRRSRVETKFGGHLGTHSGVWTCCKSKDCHRQWTRRIFSSFQVDSIVELKFTDLDSLHFSHYHCPAVVRDPNQRLK